MQYEPIKRSLGRVFTRSLVLRKVLYFLLDLLLLRAWHVKRALRKIAKSLPENASMLDAGSGFGQYTWRMSSHHKDWIIKGIDINEEQVTDCTNFFYRTGRAGRVAFETGDLTMLNYEDLFDLVLTVDVMEHIERDDLAFSGFYRSMKSNGVLIISTPSDQGGSDVSPDHDHSFIDEHVRDGYSIEDIEDKLKKSGFREIKTNYTYGPAGSISWKLSMKLPVKMVNKSYLFFIILPIYYLVVFPFSFFLNIIDLNFKIKKGTGLLVIARK